MKKYESIIFEKRFPSFFGLESIFSPVRAILGRKKTKFGKPVLPIA
jgi:hypothetical protein